MTFFNYHSGSRGLPRCVKGSLLGGQFISEDPLHGGGTVRSSRLRPVSGVNHIAPTRLADGKASLARPTSFSSVGGVRGS